MNLTRRDVLKGLAALGISLTVQPTLAAESEEWRQKPGGVYVMPDFNGANEVVLAGLTYGLRDGERCTRLRSAMWRGTLLPDGSLDMIRQADWFHPLAYRDPSAGVHVSIPADITPIVLQIIAPHDDERTPFVVAVERMEFGASNLNPLTLDDFNVHRTSWWVTDDRAWIEQQRAPFNCVIQPKESSVWDDRRRWNENYVAHVIWE